MTFSEAISLPKGSNRKEALFVYASALLAFSIPLLSRSLIIPLVIWGAAWIVAPKVDIRKRWKPILIFSGLYLFHVVGMLYTENVSRGLSDLEQKFSLLLFPVLMGTSAVCTPALCRKVLYAFVAGTLLAVLVSVGDSVIKFRESGLYNAFYMSEFSPAHHPTYIAMYINLAIAILVLGLFDGSLHGKRATAGWLCIALLAVALVLPASKMGFVQFVFLLLFMLVHAWRTGRLKRVPTFLLLGVGLLFFAALSLDPVATQRLAATVEVVGEGQEPAQANEIESNTARLHAWRISTGEVPKHPFGVGTGDINDLMVRRFEEEGLYALARSGLNPHNNFLQISLAIGIPALLWFCFALAYPFRRIVKQGDWLFAFFLLSMVLHMLVESMLEKQSGVVFYAFFNAFLYFSLAQNGVSSSSKSDNPVPS